MRDRTAPASARIPDRPHSASPAAVAAVDLTKDYGCGPTAVRAVDQITVSFAAGQFTAIMGPSGSGKSTLMHCLAGLEAPTSGTVWLADTDTGELTDTQLTLLRRERVGFLFQSFNLLPALTAEQNILLPLTLAGRAADRGWFDRLVSALELHTRLAHRPGELSGGQQQRVAAARALITRPAVVFADEPTGALDSRSGAELLTFLRSSVRDLAQTIIMVTHDAVAATYADRVVLLADGRLAGSIEHPTTERVRDAVRLDTGAPAC